MIQISSIAGYRCITITSLGVDFVKACNRIINNRFVEVINIKNLLPTTSNDRKKKSYKTSTPCFIT